MGKMKKTTKATKAVKNETEETPAVFTVESIAGMSLEKMLANAAAIKKQVKRKGQDKNLEGKSESEVRAYLTSLLTPGTPAPAGTTENKRKGKPIDLSDKRQLASALKRLSSTEIKDVAAYFGSEDYKTLLKEKEGKEKAADPIIADIENLDVQGNKKEVIAKLEAAIAKLKKGK